MKKVALSLLAFALVGAGAFADATADVVKSPLTVSLEVNASANWGVDLDSKVHGFSNGNTGKVTLWFANGTSSKTGDGDVHGYISVADVQLGLDGASDGASLGALNVGDITAKIVAGDLYLKIYTNSDAKAGYNLDGDDDSAYVVGEPKKYTANYGGTGTEWTLGDTTGYGGFEGKGVEIGYTIPGTASLVAVVDSDDDWTVADQSDYEASFAANLLAVEKLTLGAKFVTTTLAGDNLLAAGVEFAYDLGVAKPFAHANFDLTNSEFDTDFGSFLPLADGFNAVAVLQYDSAEVLNVVVSAQLAEAKLAGPLSAIAGLRLGDVTGDALANEIFLNVGFKATDVIKLYGTVNTYAVGDADASLFVKAGVDFTGISLTTLSLNWDSSDLGAAESTGESKLGKVVVTAKVAY